MQLTRFDRWLREKFVYETHIYTLRAPEHIPRGVVARDLPEVPGKRFRHLFIVRGNKAVDELVTALREQNMMFNTQIVDRKAWFTPFVAPENRSVTWWLVSTLAIISASVSALYYVKTLLDQPEIRKNLMDALEILKG
jgi:hypothetical protein